MKAWWERFPGRLDREIASLESRGIGYKRDELAWRLGQLVLELTVTPPAGEAIHLIAHYPETFPYTRFEVVAPDLLLPRHQNPFAKNLCLMGRASSNWSVHDTLGEVLMEQLPKLMRFATEAPATLRELEEPQGEPVTDFYAYFPGTAVLVDSSWQLDPAITAGKLKIAFSQALPFRGAVIEVLDSTGQALARADAAFNRVFSRTARGRWVRWEAPIVETDIGRLLGIISARHRDIGQLGFSTKRAFERGEPEILGIVFPEESEQGKHHDAWLFLVRTVEGWHLARSCRAGRGDLGSRAPELVPLSKKRVTAIGLGTVGAPGTIELARNGVSLLKLVDYDFMEAGTSSRWPLGMSAVGQPKVDAVGDFIAQNYPYTQIEKFYGMIGRGQRAPAPQYCDSRDLERLLETDLILDATAESGIQLLLSDLASAREVAYVCASTTPGAWGGLVFRQLPGAQQACWSCLQHAMSEGLIATPLHDPRGSLQPAGCANPTFTGAGVDVQVVSLMAVRAAIATLCRGTENGYPDIDWNVAIATLRSPECRLIVPQWKATTIMPHPNCRNYQAHRDDLGTRKAA